MINVEGIILKEIKYGETSKILTLYTRELGKIKLMVKGAYQPKSSLIANTQVFSLNSFKLRKGKSFYYIVDADLLDSFYSIREDIEKIVFGYYILELVDKSVVEEFPNEKTYELLKKGLASLRSLNDHYYKFIIAYEIKFISFLGYRPSLDSCLACQGTAGEGLAFSIENGGILCGDCRKKDPRSLIINPALYDIMVKALYSPLDKIQEISGGPGDFIRIHGILVDYILYNIDRRSFNSLVFLETII